MLTATLIKDRRAAALWHVEFTGEQIVTAARDPEYTACRALLARGVTGKVTFVHESGMAGLTMGIEHGAGLTVDEATRDGRPRVVKYRPYNADSRTTVPPTSRVSQKHEPAEVRT